MWMASTLRENSVADLACLSSEPLEMASVPCHCGSKQSQQQQGQTAALEVEEMLFFSVSTCSSARTPSTLKRVIHK